MKILEIKVFWLSNTFEWFNIPELCKGYNEVSTHPAPSFPLVLSWGDQCVSFQIFYIYKQVYWCVHVYISLPYPYTNGSMLNILSCTLLFYLTMYLVDISVLLLSFLIFFNSCILFHYLDVSSFSQFCTDRHLFFSSFLLFQTML